MRERSQRNRPNLEFSLKIWLSRGARKSIRARARAASLTAALLLLVTAGATAQQEYITGVRIEAPQQLVVDVTVPVTVKFLDASNREVAPEPGRPVRVSPAGLYPCDNSRCAAADYSEVFVTQPGQSEYTIYVRSLVAGVNSVRVTHPNGSSALASFEALVAGTPSRNTDSSTSSAQTSAPAAPARGTPMRFGLENGTPSLALGSCTEVQVQILDSGNERIALSNAREVTLNPGGGVHPSMDQCNSYRNDAISVAAGSSSFTFYAYVVSAYEGLGRVTLSASGMEELQIPFTTATGTPTLAASVPDPIVAAPIPPAAPTPAPSQSSASTPSEPAPNLGNVSVWANDGGDKVVQEETRSFTQDIRNSHWDGTTIRTFGARNEVVSFNVVVDNRGVDLSDVRVDFNRLDSANYQLVTTNSSAADVFDWRNRPIEIFSVGYLRVHGLSRIAYELYDETHTPEKLRRPYRDLHPVGPAIGSGTWFDRPNHNKSYPDIAIPQEVQPTTRVRSGNSQSFWVDIYLPKDVPAGLLTGTLRVSNNSQTIANIPVEVTVANFTLNDESQAKSMVYLGDLDIAERYFTGAGRAGQLPRSSYADYRRVIDRHFMLAWRHRLSLIDGNALVAFSTTPIDAPNEDWQKRLRGELYTAANGYAGPGANLPHDVFSIGTYSNWSQWWGLNRYDPTYPNYTANLPRQLLVDTLNQRTDQWENWFRNNAPSVKRFLYVDDEPTFSTSRDPNFSTLDFANLVSKTVQDNPGPGGSLPTFVTSSPLGYDHELPYTNILGDVIAHGQTELWNAATNALNSDSEREYFMYNGRRPASGTFVIDDDGVALRQLPWGQYKTGIDRWYYWSSTYYNNFQGGPSFRNLSEVDALGPTYRNGTQTNVFKSGHTFGGHTHFDPSIGETGWNYSNGDGVLFYPGTDQVFPQESRDLQGPIASLRLKHWRRGVQDVIYVEQAMARNPAATRAIIDEMVPEVMWELGVADPSDPTFVHKPPSWSNNPDRWEDARRRLANIILGNSAL